MVEITSLDNLVGMDDEIQDLVEDEDLANLINESGIYTVEDALINEGITEIEQFATTSPIVLEKYYIPKPKTLIYHERARKFMDRNARFIPGANLL